MALEHFQKRFGLCRFYGFWTILQFWIRLIHGWTSKYVGHDADSRFIQRRWITMLLPRAAGWKVIVPKGLCIGAKPIWLVYSTDITLSAQVNFMSILSFFPSLAFGATSLNPIFNSHFIPGFAHFPTLGMYIAPPISLISHIQISKAPLQIV